MHAPDELYATLRVPFKDMTVLATAHSDPHNAGTGHDEPILMVLNYREGKNLPYTVLGHDATALSCVGFLNDISTGHGVGRHRQGHAKNSRRISHRGDDQLSRRHRLHGPDHCPRKRHYRDGNGGAARDHRDLAPHAVCG